MFVCVLSTWHSNSTIVHVSCPCLKFERQELNELSHRSGCLTNLLANNVIVLIEILELRQRQRSPQLPSCGASRPETQQDMGSRPNRQLHEQVDRLGRCRVSNRRRKTHVAWRYRSYSRTPQQPEYTMVSGRQEAIHISGGTQQQIYFYCMRRKPVNFKWLDWNTQKLRDVVQAPKMVPTGIIVAGPIAFGHIETTSFNL